MQTLTTELFIFVAILILVSSFVSFMIGRTWDKKHATIQQFHAAVMEVAKERGETYICVRVETNHLGQVFLEGYINGANWYKGRTVSEVCERLRQHGKQPSNPLVDDFVI